MEKRQFNQSFIKLGYAQKIICADLAGLLDKKGGFKWFMDNLDCYWSLRLSRTQSHYNLIVNDERVAEIDLSVVDILFIKEDENNENYI